MINVIELQDLANHYFETLSHCELEWAYEIATQELESELAFNIGYKIACRKLYSLSQEEKELIQRRGSSYDEGYGEGLMDPDLYSNY